MTQDKKIPITTTSSEKIIPSYNGLEKIYPMPRFIPKWLAALMLFLILIAFLYGLTTLI